MFLWAGLDNRVTLSTWKICHPAYLTSCPHIFIPQVLIWEDLQRPEKGLEGSVRSAPRLRSAIQDGTLTRPAGDYEIFIDGRNVSLQSDLFGAIVQSDIKVSQVVSLFWTCCWTHEAPEAAASSHLWFQYFESRMDISFLRRGRVKCLVSFGEVINEELLVKFWFLRRERSQSLLTREALLFYRSDDRKTSRGSSSNSGSSW